MKTLFLLRHAKAAPLNENIEQDFARPLNERGERAARAIGRHIRERNLSFDLTLCSPAERTRQTIALALEAAKLNAAVELRYDERIYEASVAQLMQVTSEIEDRADKVLLVGHNPGMEGLLENLTHEVQHMPTGALARITLEIEKWGKLNAHSGHLAWLVTPKNLERD
jgi:phosphohistidine phosphatase